MLGEETPQEFIPQADGREDMPTTPATSKPYSVASQAAVRPSWGKRLKRFLVFLFKLVLFVAVIVAAVAVYFYVWPQVYGRYIRPVEDTVARVPVLEASQQASQEQLIALQTQLPALVAAQAHQSAALTALAPQVDTLEGALKAHTEMLAATQSAQSAALAGLAPRLATLESSTAKYTLALAALQSTQASLQAGQAAGETRLRAELARQETLLKSMELLSRARLSLYASNFGLAKQDIQAGRDLLAGLEPTSEQDTANLAEVVQRLDLSLERLPEFPVAASGDLDIAWQVLLGGPGQPLARPLSPVVNENTTTPTVQAATPPATETAGASKATPTPVATDENTAAPTSHTTEEVNTPSPTP